MSHVWTVSGSIVSPGCRNASSSVTTDWATHYLVLQAVRILLLKNVTISDFLQKNRSVFVEYNQEGETHLYETESSSRYNVFSQRRQYKILMYHQYQNLRGLNNKKTLNFQLSEVNRNAFQNNNARFIVIISICLWTLLDHAKHISKLCLFVRLVCMKISSSFLCLFSHSLVLASIQQFCSCVLSLSAMCSLLILAFFLCCLTCVSYGAPVFFP